MIHASVIVSVLMPFIRWHSSCRDDTYCSHAFPKKENGKSMMRVRKFNVMWCGVACYFEITLPLPLHQIRYDVKNTIILFQINFFSFLSFLLHFSIPPKDKNHLKKKKQMMKEIMKKK